MILDCIRHGATESNLAGRFNGSSLEGITIGQRAALEQVRFDASPYDAVFVSDLPRCVETAVSLGLTGFQLEPRLQERGLGVFEGLTPAECRDRFAEDFARFLMFEADFVIPGGESRAQHFSRLSQWLAELEPMGRVLAVTHGGTIDFLCRLGNGWRLHGGDTIHSSANAHLSRFDLDWPVVRLLAFNQQLGLTDQV